LATVFGNRSLATGLWQPVFGNRSLATGLWQYAELSAGGGCAGTLEVNLAGVACRLRQTSGGGVRLFVDARRVFGHFDGDLAEALFRASRHGECFCPWELPVGRTRPLRGG
jgi:hypothetical protein